MAADLAAEETVEFDFFEDPPADPPEVRHAFLREIILLRRVLVNAEVEGAKACVDRSTWLSSVRGLRCTVGLHGTIGLQGEHNLLSG